MRVAIVGSRNYPNLDQVERFVFNLAAKYPNAVIVSGGAAGVDHEAEEAARNRMLHIRSYQPKRRVRGFQVLLVETGRFTTTIRGEDSRPLTFKSYGQACFYRNGLIVGDCDQLVAFHYQNSRGTQDSLDKARILGIPTHIYRPPSITYGDES